MIILTRSRYSVAVALIAITTFAVLFTGTARAASLVQIDDFGSNPSDLEMFLYVPDNIDPEPALLVAIHFCGGSGPDYYEGTQWASLADQHQFIVIYPSVGGDATCFDSASADSLTHNGGSDSLAIINMVNYVITNHGANPNYVYAVGSSSGAMMTNVLLSIYPDVFNAGVSFAGVPATCYFTGTAAIWNSQCAQGNISRTPQEWGDLARDAYPGYDGTWPRIQIWHGTNDTVINYANFNEGIKQWTNLHGLSQSPDSTDSPETDWTRTRYGGTDSQPLIEAVSLAGYGHTLPRGTNGLEPYAFAFLGLDDPRETAVTPTSTPGGPTDTPAPTSTPITPSPTLDPATLLSVDAAITEQTDQITLYHLYVVNDGSTPVSGVTVRVYIDLSEGIASDNVQADPFWGSCGDAADIAITGPFAVEDSLYYFEFDWGETAIPANGFCRFNTRIRASNWNRSWDGSNDYSAEGLTDTRTATSNITAYANGVLASGVEPGAIIIDPTSTSTPLPIETPVPTLTPIPVDTETPIPTPTTEVAPPLAISLSNRGSVQNSIRFALSMMAGLGLMGTVLFVARHRPKIKI